MAFNLTGLQGNTLLDIKPCFKSMGVVMLQENQFSVLSRYFERHKKTFIKSSKP